MSRSLTCAERACADWLREHHGDELADSFTEGCLTMPEARLRRLDDIAAAVHRMFRNHATGSFECSAALDFFGLPELSQLGATTNQQIRTAAHLIAHVAGHGEIPSDCLMSPTDQNRPVPKPPLFSLDL